MKRGDVTDKWHRKCPECGHTNHINAHECGGFGCDRQLVGAMTRNGGDA